MNKPINNFINKIICGDCIEVMKTFTENSIDTIITDPPYGLKFMGKKWDYDVPSIDIFREMLRVAKPGATLLCFGGTRTQHRIAVNIEDAGWILKDCIVWLYGSGFPKATDISKQLDKRAGKEPKKLKRNPNSREKCDKSNTLYKSGTVGKTDYTTEPNTPEAKIWNGWKSHGLKPAYEPILVAMKPNDGTYANNALKWGVAGLNIDGGRIKVDPKIDKSQLRTMNRSKKEEKSGWGMNQNSKDKPQVVSKQGRFPSNIILDEESAKVLDEQSGESKSVAGIRKNKNTQTLLEKGFEGEPKDIYSEHQDSGGASRFFYVAKASKSERNMGCENMDIPEYRWNNAGVCQQIKGRKGNFHPTVKPLKLMEYLCLLTKTPTGGIVLDPFAGSGTTGMACKKLGRNYILIEKKKEYCEIAEARIKRIVYQTDLLK